MRDAATGQYLPECGLAVIRQAEEALRAEAERQEAIRRNGCVGCGRRDGTHEKGCWA